jgi:hypothetical protein
MYRYRNLDGKVHKYCMACLCEKYGTEILVPTLVPKEIVVPAEKTRTKKQ